MIHIPDVIGTIYNNDAEYDAEGNVIKSATPLEGFHVNFPQKVEGLDEYLVTPQPATPKRVYAGGGTPVAYVFPDEATFKQHFPDSSEDVSEESPVEDSV